MMLFFMHQHASEILYYITIKMVLVFFHFQNNFELNSCFLHLCYLVATSTGSKLQLFQCWREWECKFYDKLPLFLSFFLSYYLGSLFSPPIPPSSCRSDARGDIFPRLWRLRSSERGNSAAADRRRRRR
jgi:hypothetical protein